jgi:hypothetical protein
MRRVKRFIIFFHIKVILVKEKKRDVILNVLQVNALSLSQQHCATNWKIAGSIPDGVIGSFH